MSRDLLDTHADATADPIHRAHKIVELVWAEMYITPKSAALNLEILLPEGAKST